MIDRLGSLIEELQGIVGDLDPAGLGGDEAMELCARFAELERLAGAGRLVTAERVSATDVWRRGGLRTAADWVARRTGCDVERARDGLETAGRLGECPVVAAEIRAGRLSEAQAHVITADAGAAFDAAVEERKARHVKAARREGRREPFPAYAADALVELVTEDRGAPDPGGALGLVRAHAGG